MNAVVTLVATLFNLYLMVIMLRLWLQWVRADFYNPFSQFTVKVTQPVIGPLRRIIPSVGSFDTATLVFAFIVMVAKIIALTLIVYGGIPSVVDILLRAVFSLGLEALWLVFWVLVIRALLSWVSQGNNPIELVLHQLSEPLTRPIRRIIPPIGGLDLSVLIFVILLQFVINLYKVSFFAYIVK